MRSPPALVSGPHEVSAVSLYSPSSPSCVGLSVRVVVLAPVIRPQLTTATPFLFHWYAVGVEPLVAALKLAPCPTLTVWFAGFCENVALLIGTPQNCIGSRYRRMASTTRTPRTRLMLFIPPEHVWQ